MSSIFVLSYFVSHQRKFRKPFPYDQIPMFSTSIEIKLGHLSLYHTCGQFCKCQVQYKPIRNSVEPVKSSTEGAFLNLVNFGKVQNRKYRPLNWKISNITGKFNSISKNCYRCFLSFFSVAFSFWVFFKFSVMFFLCDLEV